MKVITQTALRTFRKCARNYEQTYVQLYKSAKVADPLQFGTIWHELREQFWKGNIKISFNQNDLDPFVAQKLSVMFMGYMIRWGEFIKNLELLGVEMSYEIPLRNPRTNRLSKNFVIQGKLDAVVREDGKLWVVEEKTAGEDLQPESPYWRRLEMDPQCSLYFDAVMQMYNERPAGIMYFVNVKPQYKQLKKTENVKYKKDGTPNANQRLVDETPGEYGARIAEKIKEDPERFYQMVRVNRLDKDIYESRVDVWDTAQAIRRAEISGVWLRNVDACIHPFGPTCTFLPVCSGRASLSDTSLFRKADVAHEELANQDEV